MMRMQSLLSGSSGNCYYLESGGEAILIDAGVGLRTLKKVLADNGLDYGSFSAILLTHDHMDHIRNLASYCKRLNKPVFATPYLFTHSWAMQSEYIQACRRYLEEGAWNQVGPFRVRYFEVPHDATQTVGYAIAAEDHRFVLMTDIGRMTPEALSWARQADTVVIESNYDVDMLMGGSYPHDLKMRICQGHGHLSNDQCADAIRSFWHPGLRNLFLCHLSDNNNTPKLAYDSAARALADLGVEPGSVHLRTLSRREPSPMLML